jgi:hypothetical protein
MESKHKEPQAPRTTLSGTISSRNQHTSTTHITYIVSLRCLLKEAHLCLLQYFHASLGMLLGYDCVGGTRGHLRCSVCQCACLKETQSMCVQLTFEVTPAPPDSATCTATLSIIAADAKFNRASPISALSIKGCRFGTFSRCRMCLYQSITV